MPASPSWALQYVRIPDTRHEDWPVWLLRNNVRTRQALIEHPNLIPLVLARAPLGIGTSMLESSTHLLVEQGVPVDMVLPLMETMETVAVAIAMYADHVARGGDAHLEHHEHPTLLAGHRRRADLDERLCVETSTALIDGRAASRPAGLTAARSAQITKQCWVNRSGRALMRSAI